MTIYNVFIFYSTDSIHVVFLRPAGQIMWWNMKEAWCPLEARTAWVHLVTRPARTPTDTPRRGERRAGTGSVLFVVCVWWVTSAPSLKAWTWWLRAAVSSQHGLQFPSAPVPSAAGEHSAPCSKTGEYPPYSSWARFPARPITKP